MNLANGIETDLKSVISFISRSKALMTSLSPTALTIVVAVLDQAVKDTSDLEKALATEGMNVASDIAVAIDVQNAMKEIKAFIVEVKSYLK